MNGNTDQASCDDVEFVTYQGTLYIIDHQRGDPYPWDNIKTDPITEMFGR